MNGEEQDEEMTVDPAHPQTYEPDLNGHVDFGWTFAASPWGRYIAQTRRQACRQAFALIIFVTAAAAYVSMIAWSNFCLVLPSQVLLVGILLVAYVSNMSRLKRVLGAVSESGGRACPHCSCRLKEHFDEPGVGSCDACTLSFDLGEVVSYWVLFGNADDPPPLIPTPVRSMAPSDESRAEAGPSMCDSAFHAELNHTEPENAERHFPADRRVVWIDFWTLPVWIRAVVVVVAAIAFLGTVVLAMFSLYGTWLDVLVALGSCAFLYFAWFGLMCLTEPSQNWPGLHACTRCGRSALENDGFCGECSRCGSLMGVREDARSRATLTRVSWLILAIACVLLTLRAHVVRAPILAPFRPLLSATTLLDEIEATTSGGSATSPKHVWRWQTVLERPLDSDLETRAATLIVRALEKGEAFPAETGAPQWLSEAVMADRLPADLSDRFFRLSLSPRLEGPAHILPNTPVYIRLGVRERRLGDQESAYENRAVFRVLSATVRSTTSDPLLLGWSDGPTSVSVWNADVDRPLESWTAEVLTCAFALPAPASDDATAAGATFRAEVEIVVLRVSWEPDAGPPAHLTDAEVLWSQRSILTQRLTVVESDSPPYDLPDRHRDRWEYLRTLRPELPAIERIPSN